MLLVADRHEQAHRPRRRSYVNIPENRLYASLTVLRRLEKPLFGKVERQPDARGLTARTHTLVDASGIRAASQGDTMRAWKARGRARR